MGRSLISAALALILAVAFVAPVLAVDPDEVLDDAVLEQRARDLSRQLRCVVCQSQNIDNSNAKRYAHPGARTTGRRRQR